MSTTLRFIRGKKTWSLPDFRQPKETITRLGVLQRAAAEQHYEHKSWRSQRLVKDPSTLQSAPGRGRRKIDMRAMHTAHKNYRRTKW